MLDTLNLVGLRDGLRADARAGDGALEPFRAAFRTCWFAIPTEHRERLQAHWQSGGDIRPVIQLLPEWPGRGGAWFAVDCAGRRLLFWSAAFLALPAEHAPCVVAHALARAFLYARNDRLPWDDTRAAAVAFAWGFDGELLAEWYAAHAGRNGEAP
jgi:hypothetical protein